MRTPKRAEEIGEDENGAGEGRVQESVEYGKVYLRTPDGTFWIQRGDTFHPITSSAIVYLLGQRPVEEVGDCEVPEPHGEALTMAWLVENDR